MTETKSYRSPWSPQEYHCTRT